MSSYLSQFNYQLNGPDSGRRWVFLHGLMGYGSNWRKVVSQLESSERILTFDQRGHGRSFKPATGYHPSDFAEDLFLITEELGWQDFILVGHSMGGKNAIAFADRFAHKLQKLVIEDVGPGARPQATEYYRRMLTTIPAPFENKLAAKEYFFNVFPKLGFGGSQPQTLGTFLYSSVEDLPDGRADWRFSKETMIETARLVLTSDQWTEFKALEVPTLVIRGQNSQDLPQEVFDEMLAKNSGARGSVIANAGHWVHADQPIEFVKVLKAFVDS